MVRLKDKEGKAQENKTRKGKPTKIELRKVQGAE